MAKVAVARVVTAKSRRYQESHFAFRELPSVEDLLSPELRSASEIRPAENGYLRMIEISEGMPEESPTESNTLHRAIALVGSGCSHEMAASKSALCRYEPALEQMVNTLHEFPLWQAVPPNEDGDLPELTNMKRLGHALLLRGAIRLCGGDENGARQDFENVVELSERLRNCEGFLLHLLVGIALEAVTLKIIRQLLRKSDRQEFALRCLAKITLDSRKTELIEAYRSEVARCCIPRALHHARPWRPAPPGSPAWFELPILAAQWVLATHPCPYNPVETVTELSAIGEMLMAWIDDGWSVAPAMEEMRRNYAEGWPEGLTVSAISRPPISGADLVQARKTLLQVENPYGRLTCAQTLHCAYEVYRASLLGQLRIGATIVLGAAVQLGRPPACLEELVGNGLLKEIPLDPFTDAPLSYESRDGAVWSPGPGGLIYEEAKACRAARYDSPYWLKL
jgi:hypothetical protein